MIDHEPDPLRRIPTKHAAEISADVGSVLRAARLKRGASLEAVAAQTRISKRLLEALENDRFEEFPAAVYLQGFLKGYCEHLEVDFNEVWARIEAATTAPAAAPANAPAGPNAPASGSSTSSAATKDHPARAEESSSMTILAVLLLVAATVGLGIWLANDRAPAPEDSSRLQARPKALLPLPRAEPSKLALRAGRDAWIQASVDGEKVFEGRLPRGASLEWNPSRSVGLRTTAAASLQLSLNGASIALPPPTPEGEYRIDIP